MQKYIHEISLLGLRLDDACMGKWRGVSSYFFFVYISEMRCWASERTIQSMQSNLGSQAAAAVMCERMGRFSLFLQPEGDQYVKRLRPRTDWTIWFLFSLVQTDWLNRLIRFCCDRPKDEWVSGWSWSESEREREWKKIKMDLLSLFLSLFSSSSWLAGWVLRFALFVAEFHTFSCLV